MKEAKREFSVLVHADAHTYAMLSCQPGFCVSSAPRILPSRGIGGHYRDPKLDRTVGNLNIMRSTPSLSKTCHLFEDAMDILWDHREC